MVGQQQALHTQTLAELAKGLLNAEFSSCELVECLLSRIEEHDSSLNAFISVMAEQALTDAAASDKARAKGEVGLLGGLPIVHKDIFCTKGILTTCGSRMLENFISP